MQDALEYEMSIMSSSVVAILTCHNRAALTLRCLRQLEMQELPEGVSLSILVVDDGSSDDTYERVQSEHPSVELLRGDGNLYWNGGMRLAFASARLVGHDYYLWVNDDIVLYPDALARLLQTHETVSSHTDAGSIVVGAFRDPATGELTYGGWRSKSKFNAADCVKVDCVLAPTECDTFNGNFVLIPHRVAVRAGGLEPQFTHAMGDTDYGLRAKALGCRIWIAPGFVGEARLNSGAGLWSDASAPWSLRFKRMMGPKGLPPREWFVFTSRHSGPLWPLFWLTPYLKMFLSGAQEALGWRGSGRGK